MFTLHTEISFQDLFLHSIIILLLKGAFVYFLIYITTYSIIVFLGYHVVVIIVIQTIIFIDDRMYVMSTIYTLSW